jgi:hypothetical protein
MRGDEPESRCEAVWKAQEEEKMPMTPEEICRTAGAFEKKIVREYWLVLGLLALFIARAAMYVIRYPEPLIRVGFASGVAVFLYIGLRWARNGPPRRIRAAAKAEPCARFLRNELEAKRQRLLEIRWTLFLLFPGMLASWWGGGPVAIAKSLGMDAPWYTRFQESPAPLIGFALLLAFCWAGFGREARAIGREIEKLGNE